MYYYILQSCWSTCLSLFLKVLKYKCIHSYTCLIQLDLKISFVNSFCSILNPLETTYRQDQLVLWNPIVVGTASCVFFYCFLLLIERGSGRPYAFSVGLLVIAGYQYSIASFITHVIVSKNKHIYCTGYLLVQQYCSRTLCDILCISYTYVVNLWEFYIELTQNIS
jgi:hypothetical protein